MTINYDAGEVITAMVTPFTEKGKIDFPALEKLVEHLYQNGSDAILLVGTTGESPTLGHKEEWEILKYVKPLVNGRMKIIMGAGSNCTSTAVKMAKKAEEMGADAILTVVPYYNKPSQGGMFAHFSAIANAVKLPIILYNIPGRTGVNMSPATIAKLAEKYSNIFAVKQSNGDLDLVSEIKKYCPDTFKIYSGDDSLTLPMLSLGAHGVISVASHVIGKQIKEMITLYKKGKTSEALKLHLNYYPLFKKIFMCPNPVPIKAILANLGVILPYLRLPLIEMTETEKTELFSVVEGLIK